MAVTSQVNNCGLQCSIIYFGASGKHRADLHMYTIVSCKRQTVTRNRLDDSRIVLSCSTETRYPSQVNNVDSFVKSHSLVIVAHLVLICMCAQLYIELNKLSQGTGLIFSGTTQQFTHNTSQPAKYHDLISASQ